jgi:hypothetical protein
MPFIMQQQLHIPPIIMVQRFCNMPAETLSSQAHMTFMPPLHLVNVIVQRGTIIMFVPAGAVDGVPIIPLGPDIGMPGMAIPERSIIIVVAILISFSAHQPVATRPTPGSIGFIVPRSLRDFKLGDVKDRQTIMAILINLPMFPVELSPMVGFLVEYLPAPLLDVRRRDDYSGDDSKTYQITI